MMCCVGGGAGGNIAKCSCANYRTHPAASFSHLRYHTLTVHTLDPFLRRSLYHSHSSRSPLTSRRFDFTNSALYLIRRAARAECMRKQNGYARRIPPSRWPAAEYSEHRAAATWGLTSLRRLGLPARRLRLPAGLGLLLARCLQLGPQRHHIVRRFRRRASQRAE